LSEVLKAVKLIQRYVLGIGSVPVFRLACNT